ncbi:FecR domain-containing protein [Pedobacter sp.]|uniref:FecR family protein n=1 Tax=Pedobacter sp. TaxID=1411316 RepID=UPI0031E27D9C
MTPHRDFEYLSSLILKYLKNEITDKEQQILNQWLEESPQNKALLESFRQTAKVEQDIDQLRSVDVNAQWERFNANIGHSQSKKLRLGKWWPRVAAVLLVASSITAYFYYAQHQSVSPETALAYDVNPGSERAILQLADGAVVNLGRYQKHSDHDQDQGFDVKEGTLYFTANHTKSGQTNRHALRTPRAGEYKVVLPDGTKVWLNASSYLSFPQNFDGNERRVQLKGEAYFEVAHQPSKPFIVSFNDTEVKVLGTHFNISTYGNTSKTTLLEGSVSISEGEHQTLLKPGQEALIEQGEISVQKTEVYKSIAWKEGVFYFKEDNIKEILDQISRWYDVQVIYQGKPSQQAITGNIRRQATLNQVLEMLSALTNAKFNLTDRTVTVNFNP